MIREFAKDMGKYFPAQIVPGLVGFVSIPILTRLFLPDAYGDYRLVLATTGVLATFSEWLPMAVIRFAPGFERDGRLGFLYGNVVALCGITTVLFTGLAIVLLAVLRPYLSSRLYALMWPGILVFALTTVFVTAQHVLRAKRAIASYSVSAAWQSAAGFGLAMLLVTAWGPRIEFLIWGMAAAVGMALPLLWRQAFDQPLSGLRVSPSVFRDMMAYSAPLVLGNVAAWVLSLGDRYVLQWFGDSHAVGVYSASYGVSESTVLLLAKLFMLAGGPLAVHVWEKEGEPAAAAFLTKQARYYLLVCVPAVVALSVLAKPMVHLLMDEEYWDGYRIIPFVTAGVLLLGLNQRFQTGLSLVRRTSVITVCTVLAGAVNLGLNILLIPQHGYMGAAYATLISYAVLLALSACCARRLFAWQFPFRSLVNAGIASLVAGAGAYYVGNLGSISAASALVSGICVGSLVYLVLLLLLREFGQEEVEFARKVASGSPRGT